MGNVVLIAISQALTPGILGATNVTRVHSFPPSASRRRGRHEKGPGKWGNRALSLAGDCGGPFEGQAPRHLIRTSVNGSHRYIEKAITPRSPRRPGSELPFQSFRFSVRRQCVQHTEWDIDERDHLQLFRGRPAGAYRPAFAFPGWVSHGLATRGLSSRWPMKGRAERPRIARSAPFPALWSSTWKVPDFRNASLMRCKRRRHSFRL